MATSTRRDPHGNFNFLVEIDGVPVATFAEVSGLRVEVDVIEYREGGDHAVRKLPGLHRVGDVTLKRGVTDSSDLWAWVQATIDGRADRRTVRIVLTDESRQPVVRWTLTNAFPRAWEGPLLNAHGSDVAIESLTLASEGIHRDT